jgi:hypothetical protein
VPVIDDKNKLKAKSDGIVSGEDLALFGQSIANKIYGPRFTQRKFAIIFWIIIIAQLVDITIGPLADIFRDFAVSFSGMSLFVGISIMYGFGQYSILRMVKLKNKEQDIKRSHFKMIEKVVTVVQYILIAIMAFVILQIFFASQYYTAVLIIAVTISSGLAVYVLGVLAYWFLSWFITTKAPVVLIYGLAMAVATISAIAWIVLFNTILIDKQAIITPQSDVVFPSASTWANTVQTVSGVASFILIWGGTVLLLRHNKHRIGSIKFWTLCSTPLIAYSTTYLSLYQTFGPAVPEDPIGSIMIPVLLVVYTAIAAATLIGLGFRSIANALSEGTFIKDYLIITSYGFILFFTTTMTSIAGAGYPPFGLVNVLLMGPLSFLILTGLYRSAVSAAEDSNLRRSIKITAKKELKLIDYIATAEMEQEIKNKVIAITRANAEQLTQQSGIEPSLTTTEVQDLLAELEKEIKQKKH